MLEEGGEDGHWEWGFGGGYTSIQGRRCSCASCVLKCIHTQYSTRLSTLFSVRNTRFTRQLDSVVGGGYDRSGVYIQIRRVTTYNTLNQNQRLFYIISIMIWSFFLYYIIHTYITFSNVNVCLSYFDCSECHPNI